MAAGKGVVVAMTEAEAFAAVDDMMGDLNLAVRRTCGFRRVYGRRRGILTGVY